MEFGLSRTTELASRSQTSSQAGRRPGFRPVADRFELSRHVEVARTWSQTSSSSRAGLRPASELDSVTEFGLIASVLAQVCKVHCHSMTQLTSHTTRLVCAYVSMHEIKRPSQKRFPTFHL